MRFGKTLQQSLYEPWKEHYLDYQKLKSLLREKDADSGDAPPWTDEEEQRFTDELVNIQLDKVNTFQANTYQQLDEKTNQCQVVLDNVALESSTNEAQGLEPSQRDSLEKASKQLDDISQEISELERFSRTNYTGALKAAKKHDRRRGTNYKVRPLVQVRLAALPFNSEDYSPLLYRLSGMYSFIRQHLGESGGRTLSNQEQRSVDGEHTSHKFFIHPDNLLEVKTLILRHLPVLLYTPSTVKEMDGSQRDPSITVLYFDSPTFTLYTGKLERGRGASSLRLWWFDRLIDNTELTLEKKTLREGDDSDKVKTKIKDKYVMPFLRGEYKMEKQVRRLRAQKGDDCLEAKELESHVAEIQDFIRQSELQPMLRANYTRTAFQIPGQDRVRISIDTNLTLVREDRLDLDRPCRDPDEWHRKDIDDRSGEEPYSQISRGEKSELPYALMEIKVLQGLKRKRIEWIEDLMTSHLVKEAPRFSKFLHGVASLFEDHVNSFPFWMSLMDTDIRRDPQKAFQEEQDKKAKEAEDEFVVGNLLGSLPTANSSRFKPAVSSPVARMEQGGGGSRQTGADPSSNVAEGIHNEEEQASHLQSEEGDRGSKAARLRDLLPTFSTSRYARSKQSRSQLPPGIKKPDSFLKDMGEIKVEPKVWLAKQRSVNSLSSLLVPSTAANPRPRTFIKYQHVSVLLAVVALGLFNAAGPHNNVVSVLAVVYTAIAIFIAIWGWSMYTLRAHMIEQRSGKDFDNVAGPIIISLALIVALCLNFGFKA